MTAMRLWFVAACCWGFLLVGAGCAHRPVNAPLREYRSDQGYYMHTRPRTNNSDEMLFILTFSGGGTRAAALACGVLEELARTWVPGEGRPRRLLDEVDAISSVSGGSVAAATYALYGERAFQVLDRQFLKRDVQRTLLLRTLNPLNWLKLWSGRYGRSDLAADYYDQLLFHGATFDSLTNPGPYLVINATDVSTGARFDFTQAQFDLLCSDLGPLPLSRAVAASSAVPALLTPITLNNYAGLCGCSASNWLSAAATRNESARSRFRAEELLTYCDRSQRPFIHLVDGGVSDNLGVRSVLDGVFIIQSNPDLAPHYDIGRLRKVVVICVNAYSSPEKNWDLHERPPGILQLGLASAVIPMDRYSFETIELLKEQVEMHRRASSMAPPKEGQATAPAAPVELYPIVLGFSDIKNARERRYFMNQPTSFQLPNRAVDRIREVAGQLLTQSLVFQRLIEDLGGTPSLRPEP